MNIEVYDNGGDTFDRYTVVYLDTPVRGKPGLFECRAMSEHPFHPLGFGQMSSAMLGPHLGKQIIFEELPKDCRELVERDLSC